MRALVLLLVLTASAGASAGIDEGRVVYAGPDKVIIQTKTGEIKTFPLSQTVKDNKAPSIGYPLLLRQLAFNMLIGVDSIRKDGVDEAQGFYFIAPPP